MTFLAWLLTSVLFSILGMAGWRLLRPLVRNPRVQRAAVWAVIALSLALPFAVRPFHGIEPRAEALAPRNVHEFCHCSAPGAGDVIRYEASRLYDEVIAVEDVIIFSLLIIASFWLLRAFLQLVRLKRKVRALGGSYTNISGTGARLSGPFDSLHAASVRLFGKYIFISPEVRSLPEKEQQAILLHELSHLKQFSTWEKVLLSVLRAVWWWNPAFWLLRRELELISEYIADDYAVKHTGDRKGYAMLLLRFSAAGSLRTGFAQPFARGSATARRVKRLFAQDRPATVKLLALALPSLVLLSGGGKVAGECICEQLEQVEVYETLSRGHAATGKTEFCKTCAYENALLGDCYYDVCEMGVE